MTGPTQIDTPQDPESEAESVQVIRARVRPKEAGPPKRTPDQRPAVAEAPASDDVLLSSLHLLDHNWFIKEDGGGGDCLRFQGGRYCS